MAEIDFITKDSKLLFESYPLSNEFTILLTATDLYLRGLNVFPVIRPEEIRILANLYPERYSNGEKRPYLLQPLFNSRMHLCDDFCRGREKAKQHRCCGSAPGQNFHDLFDKTNLGVMLGRTSMNLVCVDCDSVDSFTYVLDEFVDRKLAFWAYQTSRGGNLVFRIKEHEIQNFSRGHEESIEIWGSRHYCVLPPSVHDSGVIYTWLKYFNPFTEEWSTGTLPENSIQDLEWLGVTDHNELKYPNKSFDLPIWTRMLSASNQRILSGRVSHGSRNLELVKPTYEIAALASKGLVSETEGLKVLIQAGQRYLPPYPENEIRQMLKSAMQKKGLTTTHEYFHKNSDKKNIWDTMSGFVNSYSWNAHGRTALTDYAVFNACCERSRMDGGQPFRASLREISELANLSALKTTRNSIRRLIDHQLIMYSNKTVGGAYCYVFGKAVISGNDHSNTTCNTSVVTTRTSKMTDLDRFDHLNDIFGKIGRVPRTSWEHLINHPERNISQIARNTKLIYQSVYSSMPRLIEFGFVTWSGAEGMFIGEDFSNDELLDIAQRLGVAGKSKERRRRHQVEREIRVNQAISKKRCEISLLIPMASDLINSENGIAKEKI